MHIAFYVNMNTTEKYLNVNKTLTSLQRYIRFVPKLKILEMCLACFVLGGATLFQISQQPDKFYVLSLTFIALVLTFAYIQMTMCSPSRKNKSNSSQDKHQLLHYVHMLKEGLWVVVFLYGGLYAAAIAPLVFLTYPKWREYLFFF